MSDTTPTSPTKAPRQSRSERNWLYADGSPIEDESDIGGNVKGFSYTYKPANKTFTRMFDPQNLNELFMLAAFGGMTLAGNVANGKESNPTAAFEDIESRFLGIRNGTWVERTAGGPRYNADVLSRAISIAKHGDESQHAVYLAKMGTKVPYRDSQGRAGELDYGTAALNNVAVKPIYDRLMGKAVVGIDSL